MSAAAGANAPIVTPRDVSIYAERFFPYKQVWQFLSPPMFPELTNSKEFVIDLLRPKHQIRAEYREWHIGTYR